MAITQEIKNSIEYYQKNEKDNFFIEDFQKVLAEENTPEGEKELFDRFYTKLAFGTGGIRGIVGAGSNRLNTLIVQNVASGWAQHLKKQYGNETVKVVIAFDSRNFSKEFSQTVSGILCSYGICVYVYTNPRPTPQLSYTMRRLQAQSGMVITASHNPPEYNGLKIYGDDGGQLVAPYDAQLMESIEQATPPYSSISIEEAKNQKLYIELDSSYDEMFYTYVDTILNINNAGDVNYKTVYTPLHGTGGVHVETLAKRYNFNVLVEPSQKDPNGNFPTVEYPNPEDPKALKNAIETAKKENATLVVANDPDADRVGIAEKQSNGEYHCITGNQIGILLLDYLISLDHKNNHTPVFINTIVTTTLQNKIAQDYGARCDRGYTGFKNIAEYMKKIDSNENERFLFGCEESYGYLASEEVRDKDGISIAMLCIKMAQEYFSQGKTLTGHLDELYKKFGYHEERAISKTLKGKEGKDKIASIMQMLRENSPVEIGGQKIVCKEDYLKQVKIDNGKQSSLELPPSDVLIFITENDDRLCVRPSGTEPKIKFYLLYNHKPEGNLSEAKKMVAEQLDKVEREVHSWLGI